MAKKAVPAKTKAYMANVNEIVRRMRTLSQISTRQLLGNLPADNPRVEYATGQKLLENMTVVQLEVMNKLLIKVSGVTQEEYLKLQREQLAAQLKSMQEGLGVTDWDEEGNPIFDLQAYKEITTAWPQ